jgi:hypothetical protein
MFIFNVAESIVKAYVATIKSRDSYKKFEKVSLFNQKKKAIKGYFCFT